MTIKVTQEHIRDGKPGRQSECPVAIAVETLTGKATRVMTCGLWIGCDWLFLPDVAKEFIQHYDAGRPVAPFEFDLPL